jgi:hypothetical protein
MKSRHNILQEITLGMCIRYTPPVISENIEYTQDKHEERGRPFGFEANRNHYARSKTNDGHKNSNNAPFALKDEAKEEEDQ